jgi:hypothetical protein
MRNVLMCGVVCACLGITGSVQAAPCGLLDDGASHPAPASGSFGYDTFVPPAAGQAYEDPVTHCNVVRLTQSQSQFNHIPMYHEYAPIRAVNADSTKVLGVTGDGFWFVLNVNGTINVAPYGPVPINRPRWNPQVANSLYDMNGTTLYRLDISNGAFVRTALHTFTGYSQVIFPRHNDIAEDGDYLALEGLTASGTADSFVYRVSTGLTSPVHPMGTYDPHGDEPEVTPNHAVLIGGKVYDLNMSFVRDLGVSGGWHHAIGRDVDGADIFVLPASPDPGTVCSGFGGGNGDGVEKIRIATGAKTCVFGFPGWWDGSHVGVSGNGWIVFSATDFTDGTANIDLPADWASHWSPAKNEIILIKADGSEVRHLAQHRSRPVGLPTDPGYWAMPRANINADGSLVIFDSNMGLDHRLGYPDDYADVYLIATGVTGASQGTQPVAWTGLTRASAFGADASGLRKSSGCDGCDDAGAISSQQITSGDGNLELTTSATPGTFYIGLNNASTGTTAGEIPFAFAIWSNGIAEVRERGVYRTETTYVAGDRLRIAYEAGRVRFYKNSVLLYTSTAAPLYPAFADTSLWTYNPSAGQVATLDRVSITR